LFFEINFFDEFFIIKAIKFNIIKENIDPKINQSANFISGDKSKIMVIRIEISKII